MNYAVSDWVYNTHYFFVGAVQSINDAAGDEAGPVGGFSKYNASFQAQPFLFQPQEMYSIDMKYDDGLPRGGRVRYGLIPDGSVEPYPLAPANGYCTDVSDPTGSRYNVAYTYNGCNMMIQAGF